MAGRCFHRFLIVEVIPVFRPVRFFPFSHNALEQAAPEEQIAQPFSNVSIFADPLSHDVPCSGKGFVYGIHVLFGNDESGCLLTGIKPRILGPYDFGQRFEALFSGDGGPGAPLGPVGEIDVFQHGHGRGVFNGFSKFVRQKVPLNQGF